MSIHLSIYVYPSIYLCLSSILLSCSTMSGLINGCADYLVDHIAIQLIHPSLYVQGCLVLQTIITYGLVFC